MRSGCYCSEGTRAVALDPWRVCCVHCYPIGATQSLWIWEFQNQWFCELMVMLSHRPGFGGSVFRSRYFWGAMHCPEIALWVCSQSLSISAGHAGLLLHWGCPASVEEGVSGGYACIRGCTTDTSSCIYSGTSLIGLCWLPTPPTTP